MRKTKHPDSERRIVEGWARVAREYKPRPLTVTERHQLERLHLEDRLAAEKKFTLKGHDA